MIKLIEKLTRGKKFLSEVSLSDSELLDKYNSRVSKVNHKKVIKSVVSLIYNQPLLSHDEVVSKLQLLGVSKTLKSIMINLVQEAFANSIIKSKSGESASSATILGIKSKERFDLDLQTDPIYFTAFGYASECISNNVDGIGLISRRSSAGSMLGMIEDNQRDIKDFSFSPIIMFFDDLSELK
jgi:hypothetical protein